MAENIHEIFWMANPRSSKMIYVSPAYEAIWQRPVEALYEDPRKWLESIHKEDVEIVTANREKQNQGHPAHEEFRIILPDGSIRWIANRSYPIKSEKGKIHRVTGIAEDITGRKQAIEEKKRLEAQSQQAQRMEAMGTLAGGIAHDFNNLLMCIQGNASLILLAKTSAHPDYERVKNIEQGVQSGAELTRQLLGFAKGGKYEVKPTDLNELIKKQNRMFGRTKKEITVRGKYEDNLWTVEVDQGQIEQVLLNLYVNAWQATPAGGDLFIQTENVTLDEDYVKPYSLRAWQIC